MQKNKWAAALLLALLAASPAQAAETVEPRENKKGIVDRWVYARDGAIYKREYDRNGDGKPDFRVIELNGRLELKEYDTNYDGKFDKKERPLARGSSGRIKTINTENAL